MVEIKQLTNTSFNDIYNAFALAFSDYVVQMKLTEEQLLHMVERRGCDLNLSFGAFDNNKLVGFTLNGVGNWKGKLTAYDTGTGIIKEYRGQGISKRLFNESLPILRENNISNYLLEVIKTNTPAYELYKKMGFSVTRELGFFIIEDANQIIIKEDSDKSLNIQVPNNEDWEVYKSFWDFHPS